jgi:hypothetical protein
MARTGSPWNDPGYPIIAHIKIDAYALSKYVVRLL